MEARNMSGRPVTSPFTVNRQRSPSPTSRASGFGNGSNIPLPDNAKSPRRSGSFAAPPMAPPSPMTDWSGGDETALDEEDVEAAPHHKATCPRSKSRTRTIPRHSSHDRSTIDGTVLHPKPWGARDPSEIKCFCFSLPKTADVIRSRSRSPIKATPSDTEVKKLLRDKIHNFRPRYASVGPATMKMQEAKRKKMMADSCEEFCLKMYRQFGKLTEQELNSVLEKIQKILGKSGIQTKRNKPVETLSPKTTKRSINIKNESMIPIQPRKSKSPEPPHTVPSNSPDVRMDVVSMSKPAVTGKVEKNQYMIEVCTNTSGANFRDIIGSINSSLMNNAPYHGDSQIGPKFSMVNKTVYGDVPDGYDRMTLMSLDKEDSGPPVKNPVGTFCGKRDVRSLQAKDIRVIQDINEQNYTFYMEEDKKKFTKRMSNTQAEMFINSQNKGPMRVGKNHSEIPPVAKIYYVQNELPPAKPRALPRSKRI